MYCNGTGCFNKLEEGQENICRSCEIKAKKSEARQVRATNFRIQAAVDSASAGRFSLVPLNQGSTKGQAVQHGQGLSQFLSKEERERRRAKKRAERETRESARKARVRQRSEDARSKHDKRGETKIEGTGTSKSAQRNKRKREKNAKKGQVRRDKRRANKARKAK